MTLRDFSDKAYAKIKTKLQGSIMEGEYDPGDLQYLEEYFQFREQHGSDAYFEHYKKLEMFGDAAERLNKVFKDVQAHDAAMPANVAATKEHLASFRSVVFSMTEMINPRPAGGGPCALTLPPSIYQGLVANSAKALEDLALRRFAVLDKDGKVISYNWDEMERVTQRDAKDITPAEYMVLARLYSQMGEEDMARFFQILAEPDENNNVDDGSKLLTNSWTFDEAKIAFLQTALVAVYEKEGRGLTDDAYAHLSVLQVLPYLGVIYIKGATVPIKGIQGEFGADYPSISISIGPDGAVTINYPTPIYTGKTDRIWEMEIGVESQKLSAPQRADIVVGNLLGMTLEELKEKFGIKSLVSSLVYQFFGFVPGLEALTGIAGIGGAISDYGEGNRIVEKYAENAETIGVLAAVYGLFDFDAVVVPLPNGDVKVFVYPGSDTARLIGEFNALLDSLPGRIEDMKRRRDAGEGINGFELSQMENADTLRREIGHPITVEDLQNHPETIFTLRKCLDDAKLL